MEMKTREKQSSKNSKIGGKKNQATTIIDFKKMNKGPGKLITSKLEQNKSKENSEDLFKLNFEEQRPTSVDTAATKNKNVHSQINNFLMEPGDIPEESDSDLTAKSEKIQFIYKKLGSKQKFEEYLTQRKADIIRDRSLENDENGTLNGKGKYPD